MKTLKSHHGTAGAGKLLADSWIAFYADPANEVLRNAFTHRLDQEIRYRLPGDTLGGLLRGQESEIRQMALELLSAKFVHGNHALLVATEVGLMRSIEEELRRSIGAALEFSKRRVARESSRVRRRRVSYDDLPEGRFVPLVSMDLACLPVDRCLGVLRRDYSRREKRRNLERGRGLGACSYFRGNSDR
jgi:hypothetical protein